MPDNLMPTAVAERTAFLDLLETLTPEQWATESLCAGWSVRDVATHVVSYDALSPLQLAGTMLKARGSIDRSNNALVKQHRDLSTDEVVELVRRYLKPAGLSRLLKGAVAVTDCTIHHQDVRRALGLQRTVPTDQLEAVLDTALIAPTVPARKNAKGLRLEATDSHWTHGDGPLVSGPGEALLMAIAGRPDALSDLSGPGLDTLRKRIG